MVTSADQVAEGRNAYEHRAWAAAHDSLSAADRTASLDPGDLNRLAVAAYMLARNEDFYALMERVHRLHLDAGATLLAVRAAYWIGMLLLNDGEVGRASGWLGRAERLMARVDEDCVERGYMLMPAMFQRLGAGDPEGGAELAARAAEYGERFGDADLLALALQARGRILVEVGRLADGQKLLDEAMVSVTTRELSPIVSGIVYCGVILACQQAFDLGRAREWTAALTRWCDGQPDLVAFSGRCLVHRAEIMQRDGAWSEALDEARAAVERCAAARNRRAAGQAAYVQGELHRVRGDLDAAEAAYREASGWGREPQPGLALLRVAQGRTDAAVTAIRRALKEAPDAAYKMTLLPAGVEILLLDGHVGEARAACDELERLAAGHPGDLLAAMAAQARGSVDLVAGDTEAALGALRRAVEAWEDLGAPYEAGRARALLAVGRQQMGDDDAAAMEMDAARKTFARLGAAEPEPLVPADGDEPDEAAGLTLRELEVLRLVAAGETNKAIAARLVLSERTVHRHVSNIFAKLRVSSRAGATAYAYEHGLV